MATNHTEYYELNQWLSTDQVLRTDFNADNTKIDAALAGLAEDLETEAAARAEKADQTALTALAATVPLIAVGTYTGDGTAERTIPLSFTPKAVFVLPKGGQLYIRESAYYYIYGGLAVTGGDAVDVMDNFAVSITTNGFRVANRSLDDGRKSTYTNAEGMIFYYLAVG